MRKPLAIFNLPFTVASKTELREKLILLSRAQEASSVAFVNAHLIAESSKDPSVLQNLNRITLIIPDGTPVVWAMHAVGAKDAIRYSGPDLMTDLLRETPSARHFFLGSSEMVLSKMKAHFKGLAAGFYSPPFVKDVFSEEEIEKQIKMIRDSKADFIWVGLGAPKQEKHVARLAQRAQRGVFLAVGAAFDFYAGTKPRAPAYLQKAGLEWAFRLFTEPRRLAIRYIKTNPVFIILALREVLTQKRRE